MVQEVRFCSRIGQDPLGKGVLHEVRSTLGLIGVLDVRTVKVYRFQGLSPDEVRMFTNAIIDPVCEESRVNGRFDLEASQVLEVGYQAGVMNPESASLLKAAHELELMRLVAADSSREYHFFGQISEEDLAVICDRLLVNQTVEQVITACPESLLISGVAKDVQTVLIRSLTDTELLELSRKGELHLDLAEMRAIVRHFQDLGRDPTDGELETLAQTWSEHCVHKTFKAELIIDGAQKSPLLTRLINTANRFQYLLVSAFRDNAGVMDFYDGWVIGGKVETHNRPSALEPYGGSGTGVGGVIRDIMGCGLGLETVACTDIFCFGPPDLSAKEVLPGCLHPQYILRRVVAGVRDYGNRMGIPTANGSVHFHHDFRTNPAVIVGAFGIAPRQFAAKGEPAIGDEIWAVGGRTGRDGIHGATFSSGELRADMAQTCAHAVQIGNAIEEQRMAKVIIVARDRGYVRAITDCGAGGFSSAIGEMGEKLGVKVELENALVKYPGLSPTEVWISESQERMVVAVPPEHGPAFADLCAAYNVTATKLGVFTGDRRLLVTFHGQTVCDLSMEFLHHGLPKRVLIGKRSKPEYKSCSLPEPKSPADWVKRYESVLGHGNVCSKEPILRQYDHLVQGTNALPPFGGVKHDGPNDALVLTPLRGKPYGLVISHGLNPVLNRIDTYWGSWWAIIEALANLTAVGGNVAECTLIDNFIWPRPDEASLADLDASMDACVAAMELFRIAFRVGKDSLGGNYHSPELQFTLKIPPVLCVSVFGRIPDVSHTVSSDFKTPGSNIVLVGNLHPKEMGGSTYLDVMGLGGDISTHGWGGELPRVEVEVLPAIFNRLYELMSADQILACHDVSEGGVATTLAEMCWGGDMGATFDLAGLGIGRPDFRFFNEMAGCFLVEMSDAALAKDPLSGVPHRVVGRTMRNRTLTIRDEKDFIMTVATEQLRTAWQRPMREVFNA